jgi:hypothetical protein
MKAAKGIRNKGALGAFPGIWAFGVVPLRSQEFFRRSANPAQPDYFKMLDTRLIPIK